MPRGWHRKSNPATDERKPRDALKEYRETTEKFNKVWNKVSPTLDELLWDCKRANGKRDLFERSLTAFSEALKALQANEAACKEAGAAWEALIKVHEAHRNHPDKHTLEALEEANGSPRFQDAQNAKDKTTQDLKTAIDKVETAYTMAIEDMHHDFGTGQVRNLSYEQEDRGLKKFSEDVSYMLKLKSIPNLVRALSYWEQASAVQKTICTVYDKDKIIGLRAETENLPKDMHMRDPSVADIRTVESIMQRIKEIKEESRSLKLNKEAKNAVRRANNRLMDIFWDLEVFHRRVESAERERKKSSKNQAQAKLQR